MLGLFRERVIGDRLEIAAERARSTRPSKIGESSQIRRAISASGLPLTSYGRRSASSW